MQVLSTAVIQMAAGPDKKKNIQTALRLIQQAAKRANFILLPEAFSFRGDEKKILGAAENIPGPTIHRLMHEARQRKVWILAGTIGERVSF